MLFFGAHFLFKVRVEAGFAYCVSVDVTLPGSFILLLRFRVKVSVELDLFRFLDFRALISWALVLQ